MQDRDDRTPYERTYGIAPLSGDHPVAPNEGLANTGVPATSIAHDPASESALQEDGASGTVPPSVSTSPDAPPDATAASGGAETASSSSPAPGAVPADAPPTVPPVPLDAPVPGAASAASGRRIWPWVLAGCLAVVVLFAGGCTGCMIAGSAFFADHTGHGSQRIPEDAFSFPYGGEDDEDSNGNGSDRGGNGLFSPFSSDNDEDFLEQYLRYLQGEMRTDPFTYDELFEKFGIGVGNGRDGRYGEGLYRVGDDANDIPAGLYYLEGVQNGVGHYVIFDQVNEEGGEELFVVDDSVEYLGNYYTEVKDGQLIAFMPAEGTLSMHAASDEPMNVEPPYLSGCYRVGIDIPAGRYRVTVEAEAAAVTESESGAFVMKDLSFEEDSIVKTAYVIPGGRQTITVEDGQYLELYAAKAVPVD